MACGLGEDRPELVNTPQRSSRLPGEGAGSPQRGWIQGGHDEAAKDADPRVPALPFNHDRPIERLQPHAQSVCSAHGASGIG